MTYVGTISKGVVILPPDANLEDGTKVRVEPMPSGFNARTLGQRLMRFAGTATGLPTDLARNHDHYLHGRAKK